MNCQDSNFQKRKQIRLSGYDYSGSGYYFITICAQDRDCIFGSIVGVGRDRPVSVGRDRPVSVGRDRPVSVGRDRPEMILNEYGKIVENVWNSLPQHHPVELDMFQIMPNHIHFVLVIDQTYASRDTGVLPTGESRLAPTTPTKIFKPTLGFIIGMFKTECTKHINQIRKTPGEIIFQRNYYEHIIRNELELNKIREYIKLNPEMWERDRNNPNHI